MRPRGAGGRRRHVPEQEQEQEHPWQRQGASGAGGVGCGRPGLLTWAEGAKGAVEGGEVWGWSEDDGGVLLSTR